MKQREKQPTKKYTADEQRRQDRVHGVSFTKKLILAPLLFLMRLWTITLRFRFVDGNDVREVLKTSKKGYLITFWHCELFTIIEMFKRYRVPAKVPMNGLVSPSSDGAWLATIFRLVNVHTVRGSTSRRGGQALLEMAHLLADNQDVAITPDGPRGPCFHFNQGAALLAQKSHTTVALLSMRPARAWRFNSWDNFSVPVPFSRIDIRLQFCEYEPRWDEISTTDLAKEFEQKLCALGDYK